MVKKPDVMEYNVHTLQNGIRILHIPSVSSITHACLLINTGSRDEEDEQAGLAHFIEHLIFKRTEKRNTQQILNRLENVGADLNAYTTKEYTCIHASFLKPYADRALELFNDIVFHSTFPESEMKKERGIILDEIASYLDQPEEAINDDFEDLIFAGHPLGRNILGTPAIVKKLNRKNISDFISQNYCTSQIVVAVLGDYSFKKLIGLGEKYFGNIPENTAVRNRKPPLKIPAKHSTVHKPISQAHSIMGAQSYSMHHPHRTGLLLLNHYLGGPGMSSVLNLKIREKHGIAYTIESNYTPLSDCGIFSLYFGTDKEKLEKANSLILKEIKLLQTQKLSALQLQKAKKKFIGQIALGEENRIGLLISMAKSLLDFQQIDSLEKVFKKIEAVSSDDIIHIANEILDEKCLSCLTFLPE